MASIRTPFRQAEEFLREKIDLPTRTWTDISHGMHARAFVVAGAIEAGLLEDLHGAVIKAGEGGLTRQEFRKQFDQILAGRGWPFNAPDTPGYRDWRAAVIYDTNLRMAYQAGHWKQFQETAEGRPYLEYSAVLDGKTRPLHREWHGTILPIDHPWWKTHYPPNGWNCRCTVVSRSAADLKRLGKAVSVPPPIEPVDRQVTIDGARVTIQVPKGIDPGFDYNVGVAAWGGPLREPREAGQGEWLELTSFGQTRPAGAIPAPPSPRSVTLQPAPIALSEDAAPQIKKLIEKAIGGPEEIITDPLGSAVFVNAEAFAAKIAGALAKNPSDRRERLIPALLDLIASPQEIWAGFEVNSAGKTRMGRRYVSYLQIEDGGAPAFVALIAQTRAAVLEAWTIYKTRRLASLNKRVRSGVRLYRAEGDDGG
jgi:SPP1 gp7 family putative phage head morphogenesis protein